MSFNIHTSTPTGARDINIFWPENHKRLAVMVSGGYDSALMLYLWAGIIVPSGCSLQAVCTDTGKGAKEFAKKIVDTVNTLKGRNIELDILGAPPAAIHHGKKISLPVVHALRDNKYDCVIAADTTNPPVRLKGVAPMRVRIQDQFKSLNWPLPFLHCDKSHIVDVVNKLQLHWITEMSHTCTESFDVRCGMCWQCNERAWAHTLLNITDCGKY